MASSEITYADNDEPGANNEASATTEQTPLLRQTTNSQTEYGSTPDKPGSSSTPPRVSKSFRNRATIIIVLVAFVIELGANMAPAVRVQLYEDVVCKQYYASHPQTSSDPGNPIGSHPPTPSPPLLPDRCKIQAVQFEVSTLKGYEFLCSLVPILLTSLAYASLSNRIGRKPVMLLNFVGQILGDVSVLVVCYFSDVLPIRLIFAQGLFLFIGGGPSVSGSVIHTMVADYASEAERTQIFLFLHAANVLSGIFGPIIAGVIMAKGPEYTWTANVLATAIEIVGCLLAFLFPETLQLTVKPAEHDRNQSAQQGRSGLNSNSNSGASPGAVNTIKSFFRSFLRPFITTASILASNPLALLLLLLYSPCYLARSSFATLGLLYIRNKFAIPYSTGSLILSLYQAAESFVVIAIIPATTYLVSSPSSPLRLLWTPWKRDRVLAVGSLGLLAVGQLVLGVAPGMEVGGIGLGLLGLGSGAQAATLSLLGSAVRREEVSEIYSVSLMVSFVLLFGLIPILSALFNKGLMMGWEWEGLPFVALAGLLAVAFAGSFFIRKTPNVEQEEEEEED